MLYLYFLENYTYREKGGHSKEEIFSINLYDVSDLSNMVKHSRLIVEGFSMVTYNIGEKLYVGTAAFTTSIIEITNDL